MQDERLEAVQAVYLREFGGPYVAQYHGEIDWAKAEQFAAGAQGATPEQVKAVIRRLANEVRGNNKSGGVEPATKAAVIVLLERTLA